MAETARHSVIEVLRDGRCIEIRALRPEDREGMIEALGRTSARSLYRRFFAPRGSFTEQEIAYFLNIDFVNHVALVAVAQEGGESVVIGGGRYVVVQPGQAEVAFAVIDSYQGQGIGAAMMRQLTAIARQAGLKELIAEILPENTPMMKVFENSGFPLNVRRESEVVHVTLQLS